MPDANYRRSFININLVTFKWLHSPTTTVGIPTTRATTHITAGDCDMKTHMDDVEDDLAAEEENKLINEVRGRVSIPA